MNITVDFYKCSDINGGVQTFFKTLSKIIPNTKNISVTDALKYYEIEYNQLMASGFNFNASLLIDRFINTMDDVDLIIRNASCGNVIKNKAPTITILNDNNLIGAELMKKYNVVNSLQYHNIKYPNTQLQLMSVNNASRVVAVSKSIADDYEREYDIKSIIIPHGVDTDIYKPIKDKNKLKKELSIPLDKKIVLWVGSVHPIKGFNQVIVPLVKKYKDIHFLLIFKNKTSFRGPPNTTILSNLDHGLMPGIYNIADITIIPSIIESFSLVAIESLASGTPIIMQRTGLVTSWVSKGDYGLIIDNWSFDEYDKALIKLLNDIPSFNPRKVIFDQQLTQDRFKRDWLKLIKEVKE